MRVGSRSRVGDHHQRIHLLRHTPRILLIALPPLPGNAGECQPLNAGADHNSSLRHAADLFISVFLSRCPLHTALIKH